MMSATKLRTTVVNAATSTMESGFGSYSMRHRRPQSSDGLDLRQLSNLKHLELGADADREGRGEGTAARACGTWAQEHLWNFCTSVERQVSRDGRGPGSPLSDDRLISLKRCGFVPQMAVAAVERETIRAVVEA
jgi:hypothetical protein